MFAQYKFEFILLSIFHQIIDRKNTRKALIKLKFEYTIMPDLWVYPYIFYFGAIFPNLLASFLNFKQYSKSHYRTYLYMALCWGFVAYFYLFNVLGYLLGGTPQANPIILISTFAWIPIVFFLSMALDGVSRDRVEPIKVGISGMLSVLLVYTAFEPNSIIPLSLVNGEMGWDWSGNLIIIVYMITLMVGLMWFYFTLRILIAAPPALKGKAIILFIGALMVGVLSLLLFVTGIVPISWGLETILMSIGAVICTVVFSNEPRLIFVLPFKVFNLTVISTKGGIPLFSYNWDKNSRLVDEMLFSGMIQGLGCILNEAVAQGEVKEITMAKGKLLLYSDEKNELVYVLVTTKTSNVLTDALEAFGNAFSLKYAELIGNVNDVDAFNGAKTMIPQFFFFIPDYS